MGKPPGRLASGFERVWGALLFCAPVAMGCHGEGSATGTDPGAGGSAGAAGASAVDALPRRIPRPDPDAPEVSGAPVTLAIDRLYFDMDWNGVVSDDAWREHGLDLDGLRTRADGPFACAPPQGSDLFARLDAFGGLDNSFGATVLPLFKSLAADFCEGLDAAIGAGLATHLLRFAGFDGAGVASNNIDAAWYPTGSLGAPPRWDGADAWPVRDDSVRSGDVAQPKWRFAESYVIASEWVSGTGRNELTLALAFAGTVLELVVHRAYVLATIEGAGSTLSAQRGIIAGLVHPDELVDPLRKAAIHMGADACGMRDSLLDVLRRSADMPSDGIDDPTRPCDAISIGVGFTARRAVQKDVVTSRLAGDECAP